jgi:hypothetical protein
MKTKLKTMFGGAAAAAIVATAAPMALTVPATSVLAQAMVTGNCVAVMRTTTVPSSTPLAVNPLFGGVYAQLNQMTGPTARVLSAPGMTGPTGLGQVCHNEAVKTYNANKGWSDPAQFCARNATGKTYKVELLTILNELGGPFIGHQGGYNLRAGYTVTCPMPIKATPLAVPAVVPSP